MALPSDGRPRPTGGVGGSRLPVGLLLHPFQVGVSALSVLIAFSLVIARYSEEHERLTLAQTVLPPPLAWIWGAFLFMGGALSLVGIFTRSEKTGSAAAELSGLALMGSAWAVYSVAILGSDARSGFIPAATGIVVALCTLARVRTIVLTARVATREVRTPTSRS